jgi:hypothetical protein
MKKLILVTITFILSNSVYAQTEGSKPNKGDVEGKGRGTMPKNDYNNRIPVDTFPNSKDSKRQLDSIQNSRNDNKMMRSDSVRRNGMDDYKMPKDNMRINEEHNRLRIDTVPKGKMYPKMDSDMILQKDDKVKHHLGDNGHQTREDKMDRGKQHKMMMKSGEKHVMMQNGKVIMMKNGRTTTLKNYTPLSKGIRVMSDGTIIQKDGTKSMLEEGQCMNKAGELVTMEN